MATSFYQAYIAPYLPIAITLIIVVTFANWLGSRRVLGGQRRALKRELVQNLTQARAILEFVESQNSGDSYITPIPRFNRSAYDQIRGSGNLDSLKKGIREELEIVYFAIDRIDDASDRQEELTAGVPATSPVAPEIRAQNLTYIRDTVANIVLPRLEQFQTFTRR